MRLAIDTDAYTAFCKGDSRSKRALQTADVVLVPLPVLAELRAGFAVGRKGDQNEAILQKFLNSKRVEVATPNEGTTFLYSRLFAYLRSKGTPIPINDLWTASLVQQHDATLLTFDHHFDALPQIPKWSA